jgi:hypothetical protein
MPEELYPLNYTADCSDLYRPLMLAIAVGSAKHAVIHVCEKIILSFIMIYY